MVACEIDAPGSFTPAKRENSSGMPYWRIVEARATIWAVVLPLTPRLRPLIGHPSDRSKMHNCSGYCSVASRPLVSTRVSESPIETSVRL